MNAHVIYHANCPDGTAAALAVYLKLRDSATYHPAAYHLPKPEIPDGSRVYFVDFSWKRSDLEALVARDCQVIVLDHHKTAAEDLAGLPVPVPGSFENRPALSAVFDMGRSGAGIAWRFFHGLQTLPPLFKYVQDRDIWKWEFGDETKKFAAYLATKEPTIEMYEYVFEKSNDEYGLRSIFEIGGYLLEAEERMVKRLIKDAFWVQLDGHKIIAANAPILQSEVGHELLQLYPDSPFAAAFSRKEDTTAWSLRGRGDFDVSAVAKKFEGGGHFSAAGFGLPMEAVAILGPTIPSVVGVL